MKTITIIALVLSFAFEGKAQSFCDTMFGENFNLEFGSELGNGVLNFNSDTLNFFQYKELKNYNSIILNCQDSTFYVKMFFTHDSYMDDDETSSNIYTSWNKNMNDGKWKIDSAKNIISFKLIDTSNWYHFRIDVKGKKNDNPFIIHTSTGDYRYLIRLIAVLEN